MIDALLIITVLWLAYSNGANDNFKGVATLWGSGAASFRGALGWATAATVAGSLTSFLLAAELAQKFTGRGLVPEEMLATTELALAAGAAAAITILLATILGMPTSTTHALVGGLLGAVLVGSGGFDGRAALTAFFLPLIVSPILAVGGAALLYLPLRWTRRRLGIERETCLCVGTSAPQPVTMTRDGAAALTSDGVVLQVATTDACVERYDGRVIGIDAHRAVNAVHYFSAGAVCFSRAVNDTPKIAALLLATGATFSLPVAALVTIPLVIGGLLQSRKVATTMSQRITDLNPGQGLTANLVTAGLVLGASQVGVPVSTTHVSCGSIFGIGAAARELRWKTVSQIGLTWITTLPLAAALGGGLYLLLRG